MKRPRFSLRFLFGLTLIACLAVAIYTRLVPQSDPPRIYVVPATLIIRQTRERTEDFTVMVDGKPETRSRVVTFTTKIPEARTRLVIEGFEWRRCLDYDDVLARELELTKKQVATLSQIKTEAEGLVPRMRQSDGRQRTRLFRQTIKLRRELEGMLSESQSIRFQQFLIQLDWKLKIENALDPGGVHEWYDELTQPLTAQQRQQIESFLGVRALSPRPCEFLIAKLNHRISDEKKDRPDIEALIAASALSMEGLRTSKRIYLFNYFDVVQAASLREGPEAYEVLRPHIESGKKACRDSRIFDQELAKTNIEKIESLLREDQKRAVESECRRMACANRGVYASLMGGELNRLLNVTSDQRDEVEAAAEWLRQRLYAEYDKAMAEAYEKVILGLPPEEQSEVRNKMGPFILRW